MPILIVIIALLIVFAFSMGGDWRGADESILFVLVAVVVVLFLVLFILPYFQEFNRSEASRARIRKFRKKGKAWAFRSMAASAVVAGLAVWWLREEPYKAALEPEPAVGELAKSKLVPATSPAPSTSPASPTASGPEVELAAFVSGWARLWSDGDVDKYLAAYSPAFVPADGLSRKAWEAQRRQRVDKGRGIVVKVRDIRVENASPTLAKVAFVQQYSARGVTDLSNKTLQLERQQGTWRITRETAVALPKAE